MSTRSTSSCCVTSLPSGMLFAVLLSSNRLSCSTISWNSTSNVIALGVTERVDGKQVRPISSRQTSSPTTQSASVLFFMCSNLTWTLKKVIRLSGAGITIHTLPLITLRPPCSHRQAIRCAVGRAGVPHAPRLLVCLVVPSIRCSTAKTRTAHWSSRPSLSRPSTSCQRARCARSRS